MRLTPILVVLLAVPAAAQLRQAPTYDGTSPGHPKDEPGPELGATADDAFALLARGDRDAARLSAARCLRGDAGDDRCRLVVEAVEAGVGAPKVAAERSDLLRAHVHFRAGADWYFHDRLADAQREWDACRRLDPGHPFCALGLKLVPVASRRGVLPAPRPGAPAPSRASFSDATSAKQAYLNGMIWYQKANYEKARDEWLRCKQLAGADKEAGQDCAAGLIRIEQLYGEQ